MKLADRVALVTGASQGSGYAIAHRFVQEGASVLLCARTADDLEGAARRGCGPPPLPARRFWRSVPT